METIDSVASAELLESIELSESSTFANKKSQTPLEFAQYVRELLSVVAALYKIMSKLQASVGV